MQERFATFDEVVNNTVREALDKEVPAVVTQEVTTQIDLLLPKKEDII